MGILPLAGYNLYQKYSKRKNKTTRITLQNRTDAPLLKDAVDYKLELKPYEHYLLDNGVPVYTVNAGAQEVLQLELVLMPVIFEQQKGTAAATNFAEKRNCYTNCFPGERSI